MKLVGFKSFADRTNLEFRPGVTVVVGPNGSGKSNLVDALSWVMGTQSTKALRTGKMEDVVFAGTATRPALNRAEATLVIDNEARNLPLDLDEVSITRRLYRDGSSDYEINGVGCRLLDIQELLSDSGVGRNQHVIIGQGEVDKVLNASPEEHRSIIEDAAGILKHRRRKERAERRLDRTDDDLNRLQDLVGEIERQMRPLKRQARAAERYDGIKSEVSELRLFIARHSLEKYETQRARLVAEQKDLTQKLGTEDGQVRSLSTRLDELTGLASSVGADLERDTAAAARLETTIERLRRMGSVAHERARATRGRQEIAVERERDLAEENTAIESELASLERDEHRARGKAAAKEDAFRRLEDEERAIATQTSLSPEGAVAALRGELSVFEAAGKRESREAEAVKSRLAVVDAQVLDELTEINSINEEIRGVDDRVSELFVIYDSAKRASENDQKAWAHAEELRADARLALAAAQARAEAIASALEGSFDHEAMRTVEASAGALGKLVSLLDVPDGVERAVEAALGPWAGAVAFGSESDLAFAVESVKSAGAGGVPVVSGSAISETPARALARQIGVDALIDLLGPNADQSMASILLGDVLVVEGWAAAWSIVKKHPHLRAVTPEGDLVAAGGVHVSHPDGAGPAMLESAAVELESASTELARIESLHATAKRDFEKSRQAERVALDAVEAAEAALAGKTEAMARLQKSVDVLAEEQSRLAARKAALAEGAASRERQVAQMRQRLSALEGEEASRVKVWEEMETKRVELAASREEARAEWQEAATAAEALSERRKLLEERSRRVDSELRRLGGGDRPVVDTHILEQVVGYAKDAVSILEQRLARLRDRQNGLRGANRDVLEKLGSVRAEYESTRDGLGQARERLSKIEVRLTEINYMRETVVEEIRRDADSDIDVALRAERPDYPEDADLASILEEKIATLRRLGPINPLAAQEYSDLAARHEFLTGQLADVESSRAELRKVISALDEEIESRFNEAFSEVAQAFQVYFGLLFPGGRGRIRPLDPDDRQAGLVIDAQPMGKKVSTLTLLSGGERSLAALAFLFAVFEARPSPFYVLDEVEAALDDSNLARFLRIVDEFRQRAQLLIVTHQQQTMEAADVLYGITMEPGGASKAVRKDMTEVAATTLDINQVA